MINTHARGYPTEITQMFQSDSEGFMSSNPGAKWHACSRPHKDFCIEVIERLAKQEGREPVLHTEIVSGKEYCQVIDLGEVPFRREA